MLNSELNYISIKMNSKLKEVRTNIAFGPTEILFKFLVLGDFGVGKTSIVRRYAEGKFSTHYKITIGAEFAVKRINWDHNTRINLQLWDIAGHERFGYLTRVFYKYSVAAAVVFDLSRIETFESVEKWLDDLRSKVSLPNGDPIPIVLLANKSDVSMANIPTDDIQSLCKKYNILAWYLTSAKENSNIDEAVRLLLHKAMENRNYESTNDDNVVQVNDMKTDVKPKSACCG